MHKLRYLAPLAAFGFAAAAHAGGWNVATDTSSVGFVGEQQGSKFNGKFESFSATIDFDPAAPAEGRIVGTVETESVNTNDYDRDGSLMDPEWFDVDNYSEARYVAEDIEATDDGEFVAHGELTIKETTRPVDLSFSFDQDGDSASFSGTMSIDRFDFNVGEGWNDTYMVGKDVEIRVNLDLSR